MISLFKQVIFSLTMFIFWEVSGPKMKPDPLPGSSWLNRGRAAKAGGVFFVTSGDVTFLREIQVGEI